ncbi:MAG: GNAT family N-acetyltransferase [Nanoarchaeota archaeon]
MNFEIKTLGDQRDLGLLLRFLESQPLKYPNYRDWVYNVCKAELDAGYKSAYVAWNDGKIVGDLIFQPHKNLPRTVELKNVRISPDFRRRDLGHFLIKQVEADSRGTFEQMIVDADAEQKDIHHLLTFSGFQLLFEQHLYSGSNLDYVFVKCIK